MAGHHAVHQKVARRFDLGHVLSGAVEVHGGVNVVTRLPTSKGTYAVHQLLSLPMDEQSLERCQRIFELEVRAEAGGVSLASPVADAGTGRAAALLDGAAGPVTVHRWINAEPVDPATRGARFVGSLGRALGRLHAAAPEALPSDADDLTPHDGDPVLHLLDEWDSDAGGRRVHSHRDLTTANVLDRSGEAVLIDWESAGPIGMGAEIGRTALDHDLREDDLVTFLAAYAETSPLPAVGRDWMTLWIRALVVFERQCRTAVAAGAGPPSLLAFQQGIVEITPDEVKRRLALVEQTVAAFATARAAAAG